ncbi:2-thiouracil desulfurase family protein [Clostridium sp. DL1XJH146]
MYIISACLCGVNCKYSGENNFDEKAYKLFCEGKAVLVCPEQLGGLPTPRTPKEIVGGNGYDVLDGKAKVLDKKGEDDTEGFIRGAEETLKIAKAIGAETAIFQVRSPSCGSNTIYDGSFSGNKVEGCGVTTALLRRNSIKVINIEEI